MGRYVIFTAIVGNYDTIMQPVVVDERFDYILFSNDIKEKQIGIWQIRPINYNNDIQTKIARWVKTHPEELLPEYDCSLWMDASVLIKSDFVYERVIELFRSKVLISTFINPELTCVYQEILSMMFLRWETEKIGVGWGAYLRKEGYPRWIGTNETGVLYRKHVDEKVRMFDKTWWWCIENYSRRDQFSFHYVLWKSGLSSVPILPEGSNVRYSEHLELIGHSNDKNKRLVGEKYSELMRYYRKHVNERVVVENVYYWIYGRKHPFFWLEIIGVFYKFKHLVLYYLGRKNDCDYEREVKKIKSISPQVDDV